ncbi:unnamed protein product [Symbiodinium natans]|uniref:Neurotransmitter-gated ion-channel ligand-binding domain-containing protein n=1 Tax=Symbiodinium natans TaxID=878477 RepID=A0A812QF71_9DINO|nr:unnamed protein product [Symbiodinium natans]
MDFLTKWYGDGQEDQPARSGAPSDYTDGSDKGDDDCYDTLYDKFQDLPGYVAYNPIPFQIGSLLLIVIGVILLNHSIIWFKPQPFLEMARSVLCLTLAAAWTSLVGGLPQFLDERYQINQTLNGTIPLTIIPSWDVFLSFSDRTKVISGRLSFDTDYVEEAKKFNEHPENMVDVLNFGTGSAGINSLSGIKLWNPQLAQTATSVGKVYVGEFSQSLYPYDLSCYPFDRKTVHFQIALPGPAQYFFRLSLGCLGENSITRRVDADGEVLECAWPVNGSFVSFDWDYFTCTLEDSATIHCQMTGTRHWSALLKTYMWPSIIYGLMGFMAFGMGVRLAMPRVAITMLALLSLTNLRNQVIALLPVSDTTSWMEEYFLIAISFMLVNLLGHAAAFHLDAKGRHHTQKIVNKFSLWGMLSVFVAVVLARLHVRECPLIDPVISLTMTLVAAAVALSIILCLVWYHREAFREAGRKITEHALTKGHVHDDNV